MLCYYLSLHRSFLTSHAEVLAEVFHADHILSVSILQGHIAAPAPPAVKCTYPWVCEVVRDVTVYYADQVKALIETIKTMVSEE